ncbi:MAG: MFS transporter permease, partial [Rhodospirillaceae bacterium]|nr:MFS transporter permease [Rhodospirillaceae bacterium]
MSEWWTYSLSSFLLFSPRTFYRLFELHNAAIWPGQVAALVLGLAALWLLIAPRAWSGRAIAAM